MKYIIWTSEDQYTGPWRADAKTWEEAIEYVRTYKGDKAVRAIEKRGVYEEYNSRTKFTEQMYITSEQLKKPI